MSFDGDHRAGIAVGAHLSRMETKMIERFECAWWIHIGKYVLRIGKPWGHPYHYAWRPLVRLFRLRP